MQILQSIAPNNYYTYTCIIRTLLYMTAGDFFELDGILIGDIRQEV